MRRCGSANLERVSLYSLRFTANPAASCAGWTLQRPDVYPYAILFYHKHSAYGQTRYEPRAHHVRDKLCRPVKISTANAEVNYVLVHALIWQYASTLAAL